MAADCGVMTLEAFPAESDLWQVWARCAAPGVLADMGAHCCAQEVSPKGLLDMSPIARFYLLQLKRPVFLEQ